MRPYGQSRQGKLRQCWDLGVQHRETLLKQYMEANQLTERPFLKDVIDDLIEEVQQARLREDILPLDTYAQTEVDRGRVMVTINSRIADIPGVKDAAGVAYIGKWHESMHVARDMDVGTAHAERHLTPFPGFEVGAPRLIVCRSTRPADRAIAEREFVAENAAIAAAIAGADLRRCDAFLEFRRLAARGGDLGGLGWRLLYRTAEAIGVNISALVTYLEQRGFIIVAPGGGKQRLLAVPQLLGGTEWL